MRESPRANTSEMKALIERFTAALRERLAKDKK